MRLASFLLMLSGIAAAAPPSPEPPDRTLSLAEALEILREESPSLATVAARAEEARATARLAMAPALPMLAAQGGYTHNNAEAVIDLQRVFDQLSAGLPTPIDTSGLPGPLTLQPLDVWTAGAALTVPLVAPSAWSDLAAARQGANAAEAQAEAAGLSLDAGLERAAWLTQAAEARVDATAHAASTARAHLESTRRRLDAELGTTLEVLVAETEAARRDAEAVQAVGGLEEARRALGAVLGTGGSVRIEVADPAAAPVPAADAAARAALAARPELDAARAMRKAAVAQRTSAWARHAPTLSAVGSMAAQTVPFPTGEDTAWRVGLQLTWVLYDGGARYALADVADARAAQAEAALEQATLDVDREARDAVRGVELALMRAELASNAFATADRAEQAALRAFDAGLVTANDVLDVQQRRLDAALAKAGATAQLGIARAELRRATAAR